MQTNNTCLILFFTSQLIINIIHIYNQILNFIRECKVSLLYLSMINLHHVYFFHHQFVSYFIFPVMPFALQNLIIYLKRKHILRKNATMQKIRKKTYSRVRPSLPVYSCTLKVHEYYSFNLNFKFKKILVLKQNKENIKMLTLTTTRTCRYKVLLYYLLVSQKINNQQQYTVFAGLNAIL